MTNAQIIFTESCRLMQEGVIGTTGRMVTIEMADGTETRVMEPEAIHTYNGWKARGYQVRRGEHRIAEFFIWKAGSAGKSDDESNEPELSRMFWKKAFFFKASQCDEIRPRGRTA